MSRNEIISIGIGILLAGLGVFFGQSYEWGYLLIGLASLCFTYVAIVEAVKLMPKVFVRPGMAGKAAEEIYEKAVETGGTILATHIFPSNENIDKDYAAEALQKAKAGINIDFRRIMILENPLEERRLIEKLFKQLPDYIDVTLHILARYPLGISRITKTSIPRFNVLLHQNESKYQSLLGLDDLEVPNFPKTNFGIQSKNKKVFMSLKSYFNAVTSSADLVAVQNIQQYDSHRSLEIIPIHVHQTITDLIKFAEKDSRIIFGGLFGSIARNVNDVFPDDLPNTQDMDVDVIFVCDASANIADIMSEIKAGFKESDFKIIWGDDESEFYSFREEGKVNIDIEIFTRNSDFYKRNILLSYSIFRYFLPLYSRKDSNISDHLAIQKGPLREFRRWVSLLKDRKGYLDFKRSLSQHNSNIDPRRVLSLVLRNFVWAASGHYPATAKISLDYLRLREDLSIDKVILDTAATILSSGTRGARDEQYRYLLVTANILDALALYAVNKPGVKEEIGDEAANKCIQPTLVPRAADA